ncbi:MAG: PAC2 family protein, partial [Candidatus Aenigmatarchaeota archaeon]
MIKIKSEINFFHEPELENPVLVEGLPGIGYVGKLAIDHLIDELDAEKFGEMTSPYFPHHVKIKEDGVLETVKIDFYQSEIDGRDFVFLAGDVQATSSEGHYEVTEKLLDLAEQIGVQQIFSLGGYATGEHKDSQPKVVATTNNEGLLEKYREEGVEVDEKSGPILGVSGLLLAKANSRGLDGSALLGETHGMLVDHRSAQSV